jgi:hypothetical protein
MPGSRGQLWHTIRHGEGFWQSSFDLVESEVQGGPGGFVDAGCAGTGAAVHLIGVGFDNQLWHTIRYEDGSWQPSFGLIEGVVQGGPSGGFMRVSCGGTGDDLQVVGLGVDNQLYHTIRRRQGSWQSPFLPVNSAVQGGPGGFTEVSCAGTGAAVQLAGVGSDNQLWHTIRYEDGSWQGSFGLVEGVVQGGPRGGFDRVSCAGTGHDLQLVCLGTDGLLWHATRHAEGSWQEPFVLVESKVQGGPTGFWWVDCAGIGADLQLVGVGTALDTLDFRLYHTIRHEDGSWQPSFGLIEGAVQGGPPQFNTVACAAGPNDSLHVLGSQGQFATL